jgi:DegV family protein with EDD domain
MEKIGLVTEQGADLPKDLIEECQIVLAIVKLYWPDVENLPGENIFQKMREVEKRGIKSFGKTSQPSPKSFLDCYKQQLERFEQVLCITITSKLSGTYNSAIQARNFLLPEEQKRVFIVDSLNASAGEALPVLRAIDLIKEGKRIEEILEDLKEIIPNVHLFLMFKDPKWLEASGRISSLVAGLLRRIAKIGIRPLLTFKEGLLVRAGVKLQAKDIPTALFKQFEKEIKKSKSEQKKIRIVITHGDNPEGAQRLKEMIEKNFSGAKVSFINIVNDIVGTLVGPDTLACGWYEE